MPVWVSDLLIQLLSSVILDFIHRVREDAEFASKIETIMYQHTQAKTKEDRRNVRVALQQVIRDR